jgi:hypothetical protein
MAPSKFDYLFELEVESEDKNDKNYRYASIDRHGWQLNEDFTIMFQCSSLNWMASRYT